MKVKNLCNTFKRGYYRPTTMPLWKLIIVYFIWVMSISTYALAIFYNILFAIAGLLFQMLALSLPIKWDTGSWRETEKGKQYIKEYDQV